MENLLHQESISIMVGSDSAYANPVMERNGKNTVNNTKYELKSGRYEAIEYFEDRTGENSVLKYQVILDVKVTEKSYMFNLINIIQNFGDQTPHISAMFGEKKQIRIRRDKPSNHAIRVWNDNSFTIYPYRSGVPYSFKEVKA